MLTGDLPRRSNHERASPLCAAAGPPRQIWPPERGLSSSSATRAPDSEALTAAASPAGPAPMTATSKTGMAELFIRADFHSVFANDLTTLHVRFAVDRDAAFEADAHAAERRARLAGDGSAARKARSEDGNSGDGSRRYSDGSAIDANCDSARHGSARWSFATEDMARRESRNGGPILVPRQFFQ